MCILFGHKFEAVSDGGYCKKCGWFLYTSEYKGIEYFSKLGLLKQKGIK